MKVASSRNRAPAPVNAKVAEMLAAVSPGRLRALVEMLSFPRHYLAESRANRKARDLILNLTRQMGYEPALQGSCDNIVVTRGTGPFVLLGAHYDSAPGTPGADDNASALAACLECARLLKLYDAASVMIVFFNREEDGFIGSAEFVEALPDHAGWEVNEAHIFEMVGYCDRSPGSQRVPKGLPITAPDIGDFIALIANSASNGIADELLTLAATYIPQSPVLALKTYLGMEKAFRHLNRSDHVSFWRGGIPSIMWTDTSEFRNPHYHGVSDTPETLDYAFLADVTRLALARAALAGT